MRLEFIFSAPKPCCLSKYQMWSGRAKQKYGLKSLKDLGSTFSGINDIQLDKF